METSNNRDNENDPFFQDNGPSPLPTFQADSKLPPKNQGFQKVQQRTDINFMYSPGPFTRQRSSKMMESFGGIKEGDDAVSPLLPSISPLLRQESGMRGNFISRQRSFLRDQDNVVLPPKKVIQEDSTRDSKQGNADFNIKAVPDDFNNDFMNMLNQGPAKNASQPDKRELQPQLSFSRLKSGFDFNALLVNPDGNQDLDQELLGTSAINDFSTPQSTKRSVTTVTPLAQQQRMQFLAPLNNKNFRTLPQFGGLDNK